MLLACPVLRQAALQLLCTVLGCSATNGASPFEEQHPGAKEQPAGAVEQLLPQGGAAEWPPLSGRYIWRLVWQQRWELAPALLALLACVVATLASPVRRRIAAISAALLHCCSCCCSGQLTGRCSDTVLRSPTLCRCWRVYFLRRWSRGAPWQSE